MRICGRGRRLIAVSFLMDWHNDMQIKEEFPVYLPKDLKLVGGTTIGAD